MPATTELVRRAIAQVTALIRAEIALAKLELTAKVRKAALAGGLFGPAVVLVLHGPTSPPSRRRPAGAADEPVSS